MRLIGPYHRPTWASTWELLRLAWPLILANSIWTLQIVLDRILLTKSGDEEVGAALLAALLFWTGLSLFQYTANYATTFVAQYTGAGMPQRVGPVVGQALWFAVLSGLAFLLVWPLAGPLVALIGHAPKLQALEADYLRSLAFSALPTLIVAAACSFFAGRGDSRTVLLINAVCLAVNGACAYVFIFGELGCPRLGIAGAGWATVAGTSTSAILSVCLLLRRRHREQFGNGWGWGFDRPLFLRLMRFGVPNGIGMFLDALAFTIFVSLIGRLGPVELSASSISTTLNMLAILPMLGVAQGVEVLVGQRLGENRPDEAERSAWTGAGMALAFTALVGLAYVLIPETLSKPFSMEDKARWEEVRASVPVLLRFVAVYCLFDSLNLVFSFALRGAGDTRFVTIVSVVLAWLVMVLPTWVAWRLGWGLYEAWGLASLYLILLALTFLWRFRQGKWKSMRVIEMPAPPAPWVAERAEASPEGPVGALPAVEGLPAS